MTETPANFTELIACIRRGDAAAATELVRHYEPQIRLKVRTWLRLRNPELRRTFDSMDVCQSVMADFFVRSSSGQFDLDDPGQLLSLLATMARNKLSDYVKHQQRQRRDIRRSEAVPVEATLVSREDQPSELVAYEELLREFRGRLSDEERGISERRSRGLDWTTIADEMGGTADGRRKQLSRAVDRVARELGIDGGTRDAS